MRVQIKDPKNFNLVFEKVTGQKLDDSISGITNDSRQIKKGDLYIFPALLKHWVCPYKSDFERVSVSGNFKFKESSSDPF